MSKTLTCIVESHTHDLDPDAFTRVEQTGSHIVGKIKGERKIEVVLTDVGEICADEVSFATNAHAHLNYFLIALNVASNGLFLHESLLRMGPTYRLSVNGIPSTGDVRETVLRKIPRIGIFDEKVALDAMVIYGFLAREQDQELVSEYLKGLMHLSVSYPGADFVKDSFANFYKVFEYMVTARILGKSKLANEVKDISRAIRSVGLDDDLVNEFRALYGIRSDQVMHAQRRMTPIDVDEALKMKLLADVMVRVVYLRAWAERVSPDGRARA